MNVEPHIRGVKPNCSFWMRRTVIEELGGGFHCLFLAFGMNRRKCADGNQLDLFDCALVNFYRQLEQQLQMTLTLQSHVKLSPA
jgi:hypothetical protein